MKNFTLLISVLLFFSCTKGEEIVRSSGRVDMRSVESNAETSSVLISVNRELRLAYEYYLKGDFKRALRVYKKAARGYMKYDYRHRLCTVYSNIGTIYLKINDLQKALYYFELSNKLNAKHVRDETVRMRLRAVNFNKIALVYFYKNDLKKCKKFNDNSYKINRKIPYLKGYSKNFRVYGLYFMKKEKYKRALIFFRDAMKLNLRYYDYYDTILNRVSIAQIYLKLKKYKNALLMYRLALYVAKKREYNEKINFVLYKIGEFYDIQKKIKEALVYYKRSYECALNLESDDTLRKARELLTLNKIVEMYKKLKKPAELKRYREMIKFFYYTRNQE